MVQMCLWKYKQAVPSLRCLVAGLSVYDRIPSQLSPCTLLVDKVALGQVFPLCTSVSTVTNITTALTHSFICR